MCTAATLFHDVVKQRACLRDGCMEAQCLCPGPNDRRKFKAVVLSTLSKEHQRKLKFTWKKTGWYLWRQEVDPTTGKQRWRDFQPARCDCCRPP